MSTWPMDCRDLSSSSVKVNNAYVRFIGKCPPPFTASNNFCSEVCGLYTWQETVSRLQAFGSCNLTKQRVGLSG